MNGKNTQLLLISVLVLPLIAAFSSQSLVDLSDTILVGTALFFAFKHHEIKNFFLGIRPAVLWVVWLVVIAIGLVLNMGLFDLNAWISFFEFKWILTLLSIVYLAKKIIDPKKLVISLTVTAAVLNLISLFLFFYRNDGRTAGIFNAIMAFSHNIAPIFSLFTLLLFVNWTYYSRNEKIMVYTVALTSALLTLLSYTRGVWIGSIVATTACLFVWNARRTLLFFVGLSLVFLALVFTNQGFNDRTFSKTVAETSSNYVRLALWKANLRMVQDHPIFGVGHGQNRNHLRHYYDEMGYPADTLISHAHNQYLQVWAGTGTTGFLCYLFFLFVIFKTAWQGYKKSVAENKGLLLGLIAGLLCFVIGALTEANFNISKNRFLFLLLAGLAVGFSQNIPAASSAKEASVE